MTKVVTELESAPPEQVANIPAGVSIEGYARDFCEDAESKGALATNGDVRCDDELIRSACVQALMTNFDTVPVAERRFSTGDFRRFAERYCDEAIKRDLLEGARFGKNQRELEALREQVISRRFATARTPGRTTKPSLTSDSRIREVVREGGQVGGDGVEPPTSWV